MTARRLFALAVSGTLFTSGCTIQAPFDPANVDLDLDVFNALQNFGNQLEDFVSDPLDTKPFPVLLGGNSQRIFYATNLGDVRINFRGPSNDIVIPGLLGPSNLYEFADKERQLLRPFIPAGAFTSVATDGVHVAFIAVTRLEEPIRVNVIADIASAFSGAEQILFDSDADDALIIPGTIQLSEGRVAFGVTDPNTLQDSIRVFDLFDADAATIIETNPLINVALSGNRLLYAEATADGDRLILRDLATEDETTIAENIRLAGLTPAFLTNNTVLFATATSAGDARVARHDLTTGVTTVIVDAVAGFVTGASDDFFITEESVFANNDATRRIAIRRYDNDANNKKLAEFRADGLAGQSRIIGDRAIWVNRERKIILAPLAGGDRTSLKPF